MRSQHLSTQGGATLIEVLVAMVILAFGLLGLVGLQARLQVLQMESYQRAQGLLLLQDMASRIAGNRYHAGDYAASAPVDSPLGVGDCPTATGTREEVDVKEWCEALQGAGETQSTSKVGAMVGGGGCVEDLGGGDYLVTVTWQGLAPISAPPDSVACGATLYDSPDPAAPCQGDLCRRAVTTIVRVATLT